MWQIIKFKSTHELRTMKRNRNLTYREIQLVEFLYENNVCLNDIAKRFDKNLSTIHRLVEKIGTTRKPKKTLQEWEQEFYAK